MTMCGHVFCYQCVYERLSSDEITCPTTGCRDSLNSNSIFSKSTLKACVSDNAGPSGSATSPDPFSDEKQTSISKSGYISSKMKATIDILIQVCGESDNVGPFKAIVFSQWTSMLDLLELSLNQYMIQYRRLDGTMTLVARDRAVKDFNTDPEVFSLFLSCFSFYSGDGCTELCCYKYVLGFRLDQVLGYPDWQGLQHQYWWF